MGDCSLQYTPEEDARMAPEIDCVLSVSYRFAAPPHLYPADSPDLFEAVMPEIASETWSGRFQGRVQLDGGGYCDWSARWTTRTR
jgi:hypothetical protein